MTVSTDWGFHLDVTRDDHRQYARTDGARTVTNLTATGPILAATLAAGLTGTTGRFVGTTNGPPVTGSYLTDDFAIDPVNGCIQVCTAGGTPGTWLQISGISRGRGTLAQATTTTLSANTATNVDWFSAPAVTVDGRRRLRIGFTGWLSASVANNRAQLRLMTGATVLQAAQILLPVTGSAGQQTVTSFWEGVPSAGSYTYKLNVLLASGSGNVTGVAGADSPAALVVEDIGV